jgi:hypothetical protein
MCNSCFTDNVLEALYDVEVCDRYGIGIRIFKDEDILPAYQLLADIGFINETANNETFIQYTVTKAGQAFLDAQ